MHHIVKFDVMKLEQIRRNPLLTELLLSSIRQSEFSSPVQFPDEDDHLRRHRRQATDQSEELGDFWWEQRPGQTIPESTTQAAQQAPASLSPTEEEIEEGISFIYQVMKIHLWCLKIFWLRYQWIGYSMAQFLKVHIVSYEIT